MLGKNSNFDRKMSLKITIWQTKNETKAAKKEILVKIRCGNGDRLMVSA